MPTKPRRHPVRTCVACRTEREKRELLRIVRMPSGEVAVDGSGKLSGRGAYLCADGSCWVTAVKRQSLERALGVPLSPELRDLLMRAEPALIHGEPHGA